MSAVIVGTVGRERVMAPVGKQVGLLADQAGALPTDQRCIEVSRGARVELGERLAKPVHLGAELVKVLLGSFHASRRTRSLIMV